MSSILSPAQPAKVNSNEAGIAQTVSRSSIFRSTNNINHKTTQLIICMDGALLFAWLGLGIRPRMYLFLIYNVRLASPRVSLH